MHFQLIVAGAYGSHARKACEQLQKIFPNLFGDRQLNEVEKKFLLQKSDVLFLSINRGSLNMQLEAIALTPLIISI